MNGFKCLLLTLTFSPCFATIKGCTSIIQRNITCEDIKSDNRYKFPHNCSGVGTLDIIEDEKKIAYTKLISDLSSHHYKHPEMKIDGSAFYSKECNSVTMKCTFLVGGHVTDICFDYTIIAATEEPVSSNPPLGPITATKEPVSSKPPLDLIIGSVVGVVGVLLLVAVIWFHQAICDFIQIGKKKAAAFCPSRDTQGTSQNGMRGPDEHEDNKRNAALEDGAAQSSDPQAGETSHSQDTFVMEDETRAANGDTNVPDRVPSRRDMQRNQRDDPGGADRIKTSDAVEIEKMQNGWSHGGREPEDDEQTEMSEGKQLLPVLEGANPDSDMTGEAAALVDKSCSSPDPGGKCSIALDTGVKSARYMRNPGIKY